MMKLPELVRNVVVIGHMQHGKTSFVDNLVRGMRMHGGVGGKMNRDGRIGGRVREE